MNKKIIIGIILSGCVLTGVGCSHSDEEFPRATAYIEADELKEFEDEIGLENLGELSLSEVTDLVSYEEEFIEMRKNKLQGEKITRDSIDEVIKRGEFLYSKYDNDDSLSSKYSFFLKLNEVDRLGTVIEKDVALNLFEEILSYGDFVEVGKLLKNNPEKLVEYTYLNALLSDYFMYTTDFDSEIKVDFVRQCSGMKGFALIYSVYTDEKSALLDFNTNKQDALDTYIKSLSLLEELKQ